MPLQITRVFIKIVVFEMFLSKILCFFDVDPQLKYFGITILSQVHRHVTLETLIKIAFIYQVIFNTIFAHHHV